MLKFFGYFLFVCLALLFKLVPHLPNFSPELVFSLYFLINYKKSSAILGIFFMWIICDVSYAFIYHIPAFGSWSLFTYSALLIYFMLINFGDFKNKIKASKKQFIILSVFGVLIFWLWTNLGVYLLSGIYVHNFLRLISCYYLALPFLAYSLGSAVFWAVLIPAVITHRKAVQQSTLLSN